MSENGGPNKRDKSRLSNVYRLVIIDDDTLGEVKSKRFSILGMLLLFSLIGLIISILTAAILCFTPLRYLVPGYADITNNQVYMGLTKRIEELEKEVEAQVVYTKGITNMLNPTEQKLNEIQDNNHIVEINLTKQANITKSGVELSLEHYYFCSPLEGEVSAAYDYTNKHFGVDIVAQKDSPVLSIMDGVIIAADWSTKTGNTISVQHPNNLVSVYKHNSKLLKKVGETVKSCEAIAIVGNTGILTDGPHVHFEMWYGGKPLNPQGYINI